MCSIVCNYELRLLCIAAELVQITEFQLQKEGLIVAKRLLDGFVFTQHGTAVKPNVPLKLVSDLRIGDFQLEIAVGKVPRQVYGEKCSPASRFS